VGADPYEPRDALKLGAAALGEERDGPEYERGEYEGAALRAGGADAALPEKPAPSLPPK
jgi:hypothetical protein